MPVKSGFFFYTRKRKAELVASGVKITQGLVPVAQILELEWRALTKSEKRIYKEEAFAHKHGKEITGMSLPQVEKVEPGEQHGASSGTDHCLGEGIKEIFFQSQREQASLKEEMQKIFRSMSRKRESASLPVVAIKFTCYQDDPGLSLFPAEVALCAFSMEKGIFDNYASLIDPGPAEITTSSTIQARAKILGLPEPNYEPRLRNYDAIYNHIVNFIIEHSMGFYGKPYLFCMNKDSDLVTPCMNWLYHKVGREFSYKLLSLDWFMDYILYISYVSCEEKKAADVVLSSLRDYTISESSGSSRQGNQIEVNKTEEYPAASPHVVEVKVHEPKKKSRMAAVFSTVDPVETDVAKPPVTPAVEKKTVNPEETKYFFMSEKYSRLDELACLYHSNRREGVSCCPLNVLNRYAYCLMQLILQTLDIIPKAGKHQPNLLDLQKERRGRIKMLQKYSLMDYAALASIELAKSQEIKEAETTSRASKPPLPPKLTKHKAENRMIKKS